MSSLPAVYQGDIQLEETQFQAAVSEYTAQRKGSNLNWARDKMVFERDWNLNGSMTYFAGKTFIDQVFIAPYALNIIDVIVYAGTMGTGGVHEFDLLVSTFPNGSFTSIFSTRPKIASTASAHASCGIGDSVTGCTAAVLTSNPFLVAAKSRIRLDLISAQGGLPRDGMITIKYRPV